MRNSAGAALRFIFAISLLSTSAILAWGQKTIHVPGDAASIQAGINAASSGDTVLVSPGTYTENINFNGKSITVTSSGGAAATVINGNAVGVVVTFSSGEGRGSVINGFTIQGPIPTDDSVDGGYDGIFVSGSNPTITNNNITENRGYGIELSGASAYISGNTVSYTTTAYAPALDFGCDYLDGVGIAINGDYNSSLNTTSPPVIDHNTIEYNLGHCDGGGLGSIFAPLDTVISNNIIANNQSLGFGGGVFVANGTVSLIQNLIYNNVSGLAGGGVYFDSSPYGVGPENPLDAYLTNNTIYGNTIQLNTLVEDTWVDGSQVAVVGTPNLAGFFNDLIIANDSYSAIACPTTLAGTNELLPAVVNSDVLNTGGAAYGSGCAMPADSTGNISVDPKFNSPSTGDFHLQAGSPAIDTGFNAAPGILATDISGNPRIQNASGASEPVVDMGVYEATGAPESRLTSETTLTVQPATVYYGQTVNLSSTVTDSSGSPISPGTVSVMDDWSMIQQEALNSSGGATGTASSFSLGVHWLISSFGGNSSYRPSISVPTEVQVSGFSTSTTLTFSPTPVNFGNPETLTANVALLAGNPAGTGTPTGNVEFYGADPFGVVQPTAPVNANGTASYTTSSLPSGTAYIQALYQPTGGFLASNSLNLPLQVSAPPVATVVVSLSSDSITISQPLSATVTVNGTKGNPTPTGSVTLTSGIYSSSATALTGGQATIDVPADSLTAGNDTLTAQYSGDSLYSAASGSETVLIVAPGFAVTGTAVSVAPGATTGNQSTIIVTPQGGFTGAVTLTASITSSPAGAIDQPALSFGATSPASITGSAAVTAMLTVTTTAPTTSALKPQLRPGRRRLSGGWAALACVLLLVAPSKRKRWRTRLGVLVLLMTVVSGVVACGSSSGGSGGGGGGGNSGTTAGVYTITVTATSGALQQTSTVILTVN
jgi:parallel beta-helix repeat protein